MPPADPTPDATVPAAFTRLCGGRAWSARLADLTRRAQSGTLSGRAAQQRHALEFVLARAADPRAAGRLSLAERRVLAFAQDAVRLARSLPEAPRARLRALIQEGLTGERHADPAVPPAAHRGAVSRPRLRGGFRRPGRGCAASTCA